MGRAEDKSRTKYTFEYYYHTYYRQALGYVMKRVGYRQDAEDLTTDAFLSCFKNFDRFDVSRASFSTWLYVILENRLKNFYRNQQRDQKENTELDEKLPAEGDFQEELAEAEQLTFLREHLAAALQELKEPQRSIVIWKYFQNKTSAEIGERLGISSGNVRVQLNRAICKLREYFNKNKIRWE